MPMNKSLLKSRMKPPIPTGGAGGASGTGGLLAPVTNLLGGVTGGTTGHGGLLGGLLGGLTGGAK